MKMSHAYAVILAGGNGERFWPMSTAARPKQFVSLFGGKPLIRHAVDRLEGLIPPENVLVITAKRLVPQTRRALPMLARANIVGEPCRRDTAAAVACACGLVAKLGGPDAVGCILTADQLMDPPRVFRRTLRDAIAAARRTDAIVTMGLVPDYPATAFGYIECAERIGLKTKTVFHRVARFVEKPDRKTAAAYLASGRFCWNAGMFIWKAKTMAAAFADHAPDFSALIEAVAASTRVAPVLAKLYPALRSISVDYAVMEKVRNIVMAKSEFRWDDVGSWLAIPRHFPQDGAGNTRLGRTALVDTADSIVVSEGDHLTAVVGLADVVVVHTAAATLVCAKDKVQDIRRLVKTLDDGQRRPGQGRRPADGR
ncbi:MAG: mannose-1-phosphate guanylyltransferase [Kiritimatiellia bacterium]